MADIAPLHSDSEEEDQVSTPSKHFDSSKDDSAGALKAIFSQFLAKLLIFVPGAIFLWVLDVTHTSAGFLTITEGGVTETKPLWKFIFNFLSIIPLAWLISECVEHVEKKVGPSWGVLINSTFGNLVEIILSVQAIRQDMVKVVQSSLLGAILMNLLFVLGCCFFVSGIKKHSPVFNTHNASYNLSLMGVATIALAIPTALAEHDQWSLPSERLELSRGVALVLGFMYFQWLVFNLGTHKLMFSQAPPKALKLHDDESSSEEEEEEDGPEMNFGVACIILLICTVLVSFHCDWLVESIGPVTKELGVKKAFVATVLLPMVGNFSEEIAAVSIAMKGKLDLAMGVAVGSATQIALLVIPIAVLVSWLMDKNLDLDFEVFQVKLLIITLLIASLCLHDGQANWLKGSMLMTCYVIVATAFWFIHDREFESEGEIVAMVNVSSSM